MKTEFVLNGSNLLVSLLVTDPDTEVAEDPTSANVTFYYLDEDGELAVHPLGVFSLAKLGGQTGFWGVVVDVSGYLTDLQNMIATVEAVVAGNTRMDMETVFELLRLGSPSFSVTNPLDVSD